MVLTVANSKLSNNRAAGNGGAVFLSNISSIEPCNMFLESTVWNNSASKWCIIATLNCAVTLVSNSIS